jgi:DNA invertase Pin-like site-specific DNA recombinase
MKHVRQKTIDRATRVGYLLNLGVPMNKIAKKWGVHRHTVERWARVLKEKTNIIVDKDSP